MESDETSAASDKSSHLSNPPFGVCLPRYRMLTRRLILGPYRSCRVTSGDAERNTQASANTMIRSSGAKVRASGFRGFTTTPYARSLLWRSAKIR